jgi:protein SCO1
MKLRTASRLVVIALVVIVGAALYVVHGSGAAPRASALLGTDLSVSGRYPGAAAFQLKDQYGKSVSLAQFKGQPVVLTFLYTRCPDECPLTAEKIRAALAQLGKAGDGVAVLVVSTDPTGDTQAAALAFSQTHQMANRWHYLIGSCAQLSAVWKAYGVASDGCQHPADGVTHTLGLYLIDKQGHERAYLSSEFSPAMLATDLRVLNAE